MTITEQLLIDGQSEAGGWNRKQVEILGLDWPLSHGWKFRLIGKPISAENAERFLSLRGQTIRAAKDNPMKSDLPFPADCPKTAFRTVQSFWTWLERQPISTRSKINDALVYVVRKNNQSIQKP